MATNDAPISLTIFSRTCDQTRAASGCSVERVGPIVSTVVDFTISCCARVIRFLVALVILFPPLAGGKGGLITSLPFEYSKVLRF